LELSRINKKLLLIIFLIFLYAPFFLSYLHDPCKGGFIGSAIDQIYIAKALDKPYFLDSFWKDNIYADKFKGLSDSFSFTSLVFVLSTVSNIAPKYIIFIPFGGIVSSLAYFIISREIFNDFKISYLLSSYFILFSSTTGLINGYVASWAFLLYSVIIFTSIKLFSRTDFKKDSSYLIILILLYLSIMGMWHTMEIRVLSFILTFNLLLLFANIITKKQEYKPRLHITLVFFIITLTVKEIWYAILPHSSADILINSYLNVFSKFVTTFDKDNMFNSLSNYYYTSPQNSLNPLYLFLEIIMLICIFIPLIVSFFLIDIQNIKAKIINRDLIIKWSIVVSWIIITIMYGLQGGAGPGLLFYVFPIVSTISLDQITKKTISFRVSKNLVCTYLILMLVLQMGLTIITINKSQQSSYLADYEDVSSSSSWFFNHIYLENNTTQNSLSDFFTAGIYIIEAAEKAYVFNYTVWSPKSYEKLDTLQKFETPYIIVDNKDFNQPVLTDQGWIPLKPLSLYNSQLNSNTHINYIYSDGFFIIFKIY
jgi:hypothetical protein